MNAYPAKVDFIFNLGNVLKPVIMGIIRVIKLVKYVTLLAFHAHQVLLRIAYRVKETYFCMESNAQINVH